jgi:hypothetical protein
MTLLTCELHPTEVHYSPTCEGRATIAGLICPCMVLALADGIPPGTDRLHLHGHNGATVAFTARGTHDRHGYYLTHTRPAPTPPYLDAVTEDL